MAVARALELGYEEIGCVSTGNVGTATASLAPRRASRAYIFYPANLERAKARGCRALGAEVCQVNGNYDEANRACRELAEATGMQFANITLRPFYAEGAKTLAYEVVEQLDWRLARPHRHARRRRHPLLAGAQGPQRDGDGRHGGDRRHQAPRRPALRLLADHDRDRSTNSGEIVPQRPRDRSPSRWRSARPATARWSSTRCAAAADRRRRRPTARSSGDRPARPPPRESSPSPPAAPRSRRR